jgi:phosphatidylglycerophosphate synthase
MLSNYSKIRKATVDFNRSDSFFSKMFGHPFSLVIVALVEKTPVSPNFLTFISLCLSVLGTYFIAFMPGHLGLIYAALILHSAYIFDCADGQLARWRGKGSDFGAYFDVMSDQLQHRLVIIAIAVRYMSDMHVVWLAFAALAIITFTAHENLLQKLIKKSNTKIQAQRDSFVQGENKSIIKKAGAWFITNFAAYYIYMIVFFLIDRPIWLLYYVIVYNSLWFLKRFFVFAMIRNKI